MTGRTSAPDGPIQERGQGGEALPPLLDLGDLRCRDPDVAGAKAAWLHRGLEADLPILDGLVVPAAESHHHLQLGTETLKKRGSGGARLVVSQERLPDPLSRSLVAAAASLGNRLVVRSSSVLEGGAEWSGAFTSYLEVHPDETPRAVAGCWASVFGVATLERFEAAGVEAGTAPMAVLVQRALDPDFGGTARLEGDEVHIVAVAGSPAPLVQGWEPGVQARVPIGMPASGDAAIELMGVDLLETVAGELRRARSTTGATTCEWAATGEGVHLLQLMRPVVPPRRSTPTYGSELASQSARHVARLVRRYPGPLGESLVLPWAIGDPGATLAPASPAGLPPIEAFGMAGEHAAALSAEVWSLPKSQAASAAAKTLRELRGPHPAAALSRLAHLRPPDPERARLVLECLATVRASLVTMGALTWPEIGWHLEPAHVQHLLADTGSVQKRNRIGFDRWEPFGAAVTAAAGAGVRGRAGAPGLASGRLCFVADTLHLERFRPRDVIVAPHPAPNLASLLWDAAAIVTLGGSPAAHLFESARALAIPAVCGVRLGEIVAGGLDVAHGSYALAVDGSEGAVYATIW